MHDPVSVLLICTAGLSTGMIVKRMQAAAEEQKLAVQIRAVSVMNFDDALGGADVLLLGPQVRYLLEKIQTQAGKKPVGLINLEDYGMMNGENILAAAMELLK
jgi:PTS system cellobiose-specific IIB component